MFLTNPFPDAFGLDIGDMSIKLVQLNRHQGIGKPLYYSVGEMRNVSLPAGVIVNGEIQQPEIVRKKILHILGKDGAYPLIESPWVVADLPETQTFLKLIEISTPGKELTLDEVSFHASKHLPFEITDTYLDWQIINPDTDSKKSQVLIAAVPKIIADSYTYLLEASELNSLALEAEAVAVARTLITEAKDYTGMARALLDLGGSRSSIIIYDHDCIQFSKTLNFSGELFTTALCQGLKIDREQAEKIKVQYGAKYSNEYPNYINIVDKLINDLVDEIRQVLRFYKEHFNDTNPVTHITMCGGSTNLINLDTLLSQRLKISTRPGNVWKNLSPYNIPDDEERKNVDYATAIGLALRAVQNPLASRI